MTDAIQTPRRKTLSGDRDIEYSWCCARMPRSGGRALDFGAGTSHLGLVACLNGYEVLALDLEQSGRPYVHPSLTFRKADLLADCQDLGEAFFDLILNCSAVEHVGLAGRYGVIRTNQDGDLMAMRRLHELLKRNGVMLLTVPVGRDAVFSPFHRVYGKNRLPRLLAAYRIQEESYWVKDEWNRWTQTDKDEALAVEARSDSDKAMDNYYALGCFVLGSGM